MSDGQTRPTKISLTQWRATLAAVLPILFLVVTPAVRAANTFSDNTTPVRLQLKWRHQFQFAGFYTALEKGYYREAGELELVTPLELQAHRCSVVGKRVGRTD